MSDTQREVWTRRLVLAGIVLGYLSYGTGKIGIGELYPFAAWRLFSAPIGINEPFTTFRIYYRDKSGEKWHRLRTTPTRAFTRKEHTYAMGYWSRQAVDPADSARAHHALEALVKHTAPAADEYRVVAESFYALEYYQDTTRYDTSTVATFDR